MASLPRHRAVIRTDDVYLTAADLARRYKVHQITIWKWAKVGILPPGEMVGAHTRRWHIGVIEAHEARRQSQQAS
jgi:hypothetical protein